MKNELLFELNNVIVSLENNNRFSEANILNREFVKIAQNIREDQESAELKFRIDLSARMINEIIFSLDDIAGVILKNPSLGMLKSVGSGIKQISGAVKTLNNPNTLKTLAKGMRSIPKNVLMNKNLLSNLKLIPGIAFQFLQLYFLINQISSLVKNANAKTFGDANDRSVFLGQFLELLSTVISIAAPLLGPAAPGLHALALSLQGTGLLLEYAPEAAEKVFNYLENVTPEVKENVALSEQGIPSCNRMTLQWARNKVKSYKGYILELYMDFLENYYEEIVKAGPHTELISSIVKNPKYKNVNQQYMTEMFAIIKCGYGMKAL
jgi:hypothetical protein